MDTSKIYSEPEGISLIEDHLSALIGFKWQKNEQDELGRRESNERSHQRCLNQCKIKYGFNRNIGMNFIKGYCHHPKVSVDYYIQAHHFHKISLLPRSKSRSQ